MGTLYLVGTPIGNLEDMTLRAIRILRQASLIAAEDTRTTGRLLRHFEIDTPLRSYHEYSGPERVAELLQALAAGDVALVSDAGMPGLSDPGFELVREAIAAGIQVVPIPGPSAVVAALVASGLPTDRFLFLGFLPRQQTARRQALADLARLPFTLVLFEAPHRLLATLADVERVLGDRRITVGRELTKLFEEVWRGSVSEAAAHFGRERIRGELTLVIAGAEESAGRWEEPAVRRVLADALAAGKGRKEAAAEIARQSGWRKREVYELGLGNEGE